MIKHFEQLRTWASGSDPGLFRLRLAARTTAALVCALAVLYLLTSATNQPLTVSLFGVLITMIAARSVREPDPHRQQVTIALLPVVATPVITAATLLTPHKVAGDIVFVVIVFAAAYVRRFGARGRALGMVAVMAYFFTLYLRASTTELPWLIAAVLVGTACTFVMSAYVLPDRPEQVLRATMRALRARMALVIDSATDPLRVGHLDERRHRRVRLRMVGLNETALLIQGQVDDNVSPAALWVGVTGEHLAQWLFDAELTVERVATAAIRAAAVASEIPTATRVQLVEALAQLASAIRLPQPDGLRRAASLAAQLRDQHRAPDDNPGATAVRRLALAIIDAAAAAAEVRVADEHSATADTEVDASIPPPAPEGCHAGDELHWGLRPTTRQAIQVAVAASLAIVAGELVSPARSYWAVIAAFAMFSGTTSWGQTVRKGWQRLLGTLLGVPCGVLIATLISGEAVASIVLILVCVFCATYFLDVAYSLTIFWITTMLALLYGLLGHFTLEVLLLRIAETAVGAAIGVVVAIAVLPTRLRASVRDDTQTFLTTLSQLITSSVATLLGNPAPNRAAASPTDTARRLDRDLHQLRITAAPLRAGVVGVAGRRSIRRNMRLFTACDRYARTLARSSERCEDAAGSTQLADAVTSAAAQVIHNIDALVTASDGTPTATVVPATDHLDSAETLAGRDRLELRPDGQRLRAALRALRQIDRAVVTAAIDLGAVDGLRLTDDASS
ncbi:FUSC family protein [Mycobacterium decipiens]|uniref:Integral membrane bound transporter domain-containing protein n=1 Tax=Mycobacterium decipiens TaxID=1430326 RepID=A0A1X2LZM6_9MYCO|nr:FUSC family protein [Mycobacterium decipiens]OSC42746.1 hypothetical protein B8W66_02990 [Mycobacterium decipiens]